MADWRLLAAHKNPGSPLLPVRTDGPNFPVPLVRCRYVTGFASAVYMGAVGTNSRPCAPACYFFLRLTQVGDDAQGDFGNMLNTSESPST